MPVTWGYCKLSVKWEQSVVNVYPRPALLVRLPLLWLQPYMLHDKKRHLEPPRLPVKPLLLQP